MHSGPITRLHISERLDGNDNAQPIDFFGGSDGKVSAYNVGDLGSIPGIEIFF